MIDDENNIVNGTDNENKMIEANNENNIVNGHDNEENKMIKANADEAMEIEIS